MNIIEKNRESIRKLCNEHNVASLYVFGSVLTDEFGENSDIDLLVDFFDVDINRYADNYFDFKFSLCDVLKHNIDLLENRVLKNPYLKKKIDYTKRLVYGH